MKRFLLIPSCALLALVSLASCQKEEKSVVELAQALTDELQQISDYGTAESLAPRVEVLNKRLQDAGVRVFALSETALLRGADETEGSEGATYSEALGKLAAEVARVQASAPTTSGEIDREKLILAVGAANGAGVSSPASQRKSTGEKYYKNPSDSSDTPGTIAPFYGSEKLQAALNYTADAATASQYGFDDEVAPVPAAAPVPEEEAAAAGDSEAPAEDSASDDKPAPSEDSDSEPAPASGDDDSSADDLSTDLGSDADSDSSSDSSDSDSEDDLDLGIEI